MTKGLKSGQSVILLGEVYRDRLIDQVAAKQHGVFSRKQALDAGLTSEAIDWRIQTGRWQRLAAGVYANQATKATWERQLQACLLAKGGSVVAGHSAAVLHRIEGFSPGRPTVMASSEVSPRISIGRLIRSADFDLVDKVIVKGFPATSVAETLWTVAESNPKPKCSTWCHSRSRWAERARNSFTTCWLGWRGRANEAYPVSGRRSKLWSLAHMQQPTTFWKPGSMHC